MRIPLSTVDALFVLNESTGNFQLVTVQGQVTYRVSDPKQLASLLNYTLAPEGGIAQMIPLEPAAWISYEPGGTRFGVDPKGAGQDGRLGQGALEGGAYSEGMHQAIVDIMTAMKNLGSYFS